MGSKEAFAYLASPAVVAASAVAGKISSPFEMDDTSPVGTIIEHDADSTTEVRVKILKDFPEKITGSLVYCHQDNLNTDGIYPGKYTYMDDITPDQQAKVVMENYDPDFVKIVEPGDILVGGFNFGTGSSREQAATALKYKGIPLVIAGSFSETYKRNALNNGFLLIECPALVKALKSKFGTQRLTHKPGELVEINFNDSKIKFDNKIYKIPPVGSAAQELIISGGLENWVKTQLKN